MDDAYNAAFSAILKQFGAPMALLLAALGIAIWWLQRQLGKAQEARDKERDKYADELREQRAVAAKTADSMANLSNIIAMLRDTLRAK